MPVFGEVLSEALVPMGPSEMIDADENQWRPLTIGGRREELMPHTRDRMIKIARFLYLTNPLARRIVELMVAFTVGTGIGIRAKDDRVQEVLDNFWNDPINRWPHQLQTRVRELSLYGEQIYPLQVNAITGKVTQNWLNPLDVEKVEVDQDNVQIPIKLTVASAAVKPGAKQDYEIVHWDNQTGRLKGEVFFFAINKGSDATRGVSDLLPVMDWLGLLDETLFNISERTAHLSTWLWDVTINGASDAECKKWRTNWETQKIRPGSFRVHNEKVIWNAISPELQAADVTGIARLFKLYILGGVGIPEHFFSENPEGSKASASEMAEAAYHTFEERQMVIRSMLTQMFDFQIDRALDARILPPDITKEYTIIMPRVSKRDIQRAGGSLHRVAQSLDVAVKGGFISQPEAKQFYLAALDQMGLGVKVEPEQGG